MPEITYGGAILAGLLSFLSPCILPMVPFYLSYLAGVSMGELRDGGGMRRGAQRRLVMGAIAFALGVTTIFVLLGLGASALGSAFARWRTELGYLAAAILVLFGLHFLGVI
ncbi:MAG TPA: cytochrome c biogenesis protein CcdA, partial [Paracoccus sp. (in: a-proteobacteria)]|nr:cytochrome c biogenesis protein CcdA [Paracoccus sp. (in: a-proteobacteria)]